MEEKFKIYLPWFGIGIAAVIVLFLVIKYVPLDPTKEEVVESSDEEIIHYEESIDRETLEEIVSDSQSDDINRQRENIENEKIFPTFDIIKADDAGVVIAGHAEKYSNVQIFNGDGSVVGVAKVWASLKDSPGAVGGSDWTQVGDDISIATSSNALKAISTTPIRWLSVNATGNGADLTCLVYAEQV